MLLSFEIKEVQKLIKIALPILGSGLGQSLFAIIDSMLVGQILGTTGLAALAIGNSFFFVILFLGIGASSVFAPVYASIKAVNDTQKVKKIFKNALFFKIIVATAIVILSFLLIPLLKNLKKSEMIIEMAIEYAYLRTWNVYFLMIFLALKRLSEGLQRTKYIFYTVFIACGINIFLNYVLIDGKWFFPALGLKGTAWALMFTGLTEITSLFFFLYKDQACRWVFRDFFKEKLKFVNLFEFSSLAIPSGIYGFLEASIFYIGTFIIAVIDNRLTAVHYINIHIMALLFRFLYAFSVAHTVLSGHYFGLKDFKKIKQLIKISGTLLGFILFISAFVFLPFREQWVLLFAKNKDAQDLINIATQVIWIAWVLKIFDAGQLLFNGTLRALQWTKPQIFNSFFAYFLIGILGAYYFGIIKNGGILAIWSMLCLAMFFSMCLSGFFCFYRLKKYL